MKQITLLLFIFFVFNAAAADSLKIAVISDPHFLAEEIAKPGAALNAYEKSTGRDISDLHAVLDNIFDQIVEEDVDILLIPGDLTNHGSKQSHKAFAKKLQILKDKGIQTYVIPGNHDVNVPNSKSFVGELPNIIESVSPDEFASIYDAFGYGNAISRDDNSLSYLVAINDSTWLLNFDTNKYTEYTNNSISSGRILPQTMSWAIDVLKRAKQMNVRVIGMMHHGIVEHIQYQSSFFSDYLLDDWQQNAEVLANEGLKVVFTGHFHSTDAVELITVNGNRITDVETGSLSQYPFPYRIINLKDNELSINTRFVKSIPENPDLWDEYSKKQENYVRNSTSGKFKNMGIPIPQEIMNALTEVIVQVNLMHMTGDEQVTPEMANALSLMTTLLDISESETTDFELDFPPGDKKLTILLK